MAKSIMIQGTASNVGKSFVTTALCRALARKGTRVAPFKAQNMALNSYVTPDGFEIGRAQAAQAEACFKDSDARMNPVLLKPTADGTSQVIVMGDVVRDMKAAEYFEYKKELIPIIKKAYESLASENDIIVIEGAGSPAEINLKENDIVNMGIAAMARAPVLLVGDIDRGGMFASFYGTVSLCEEYERRFIKGLIINKFRGDIDILRPGMEKIEKLVGIDVVGVLPVTEHGLDPEDSMCLAGTGYRGTVADIAVIRLPHISNFTDFDPLVRIPGVGVRYVENPRDLGDPDLLIIPGTKNTLGDLAFLQNSGMSEAIKSAAVRGKPVIGICGGYQILTSKISDPLGAEGGGTADGLDILKGITLFKASKTRRRVSGVFSELSGPLKNLSGAFFSGYETHMGRTYEESNKSFINISSENGFLPCGSFSGSVYGCYVHGLFDEAGTLRALGRIFHESRGLHWLDEWVEDSGDYKNSQYEKLADLFEEHADMRAVLRIIENGVPTEE